MMRARFIMPALLAFAAALTVNPAFAQDQGQTFNGSDDGAGERRTTVVQPYIEVSQIISAELTPGDDVLTYTQVAAGVDINVQGRNSGGRFAAL